MKWRRFEVGSLSRRLQREVKGGPFLQLRLRPHSSTVLVNDALHGSQSDAGAFKVFPPMQTLEHTEELVSVFQTESHAVVPDEQHRLSTYPYLSNLNHRMLARTGELDCVRQEVSKNLTDKRRITVDGRQFL